MIINKLVKNIMNLKLYKYASRYVVGDFRTW